jgi:hydrogenase large subunit
MAWDPITRIVGSLGIYTKIDFNQKVVAECHSTSSIFRGYSIFMKGKDPRDAHFITSRICGICGDNHATCSCYCQNMAYGVKPPHLGEWIVNLGEAAEYMFDHNIFQENLVGVDYCEKMVAETNPGVLERANNTEAPHAGDHGYRTIGDIMRSLNPFTGEFYREALQVSRMTREMFCLMEGRHVHPSTLYPGGVGTVATIQLMTDYMTRLMRYIEFMKKVVPMHDDLFDFFYEALPGYEEVGNRRILLGCWGSFQDPEYCNFEYRDMTEWGRKMYVTPGVVVDGKLVTTDLVEINLGHSNPPRLLLLRGLGIPGDVRQERPAGQPGRPAAPLEPAHQPQAAEARPGRQVQLGDVASLVRRQGLSRAWIPAAVRWPRLWSTALAGTARHRLREVHRQQRADPPAEDALKGPVDLEWKVPQWSNTLSGTGHGPTSRRTRLPARCTSPRRRWWRSARRTKTWEKFTCPRRASASGSPRRSAAC